MKRFIAVWAFAVLLCGFVLIGAGTRAMAYPVAEWGDAGFLDIDYQVQARAAQSNIAPSGSTDKNGIDYYLWRNRLSFLGMFGQTYGYALQLEYPGGQWIDATQVVPRSEAAKYKLIALDYYLTARYSDSFNIRAGRTKHVLTREVMEGCFDPLSADRSYFIGGPFGDGRNSTRDEGIVFWGNFFNDIFQYRLAAMYGNDFGNNKPDNIGYRYTGRVHVTLLDPESGLGYKGSYLGKKKVLTFGAGYEMQPNAVYSSYAGGVGTGAENYKAYTYDGFFEYPTQVGTFTLSGAYLKQDFNEAGSKGVPGAIGVDGEKNGDYVKAAYMLGKFQVYGRKEKWAFANLDGILDQHVDWNATGINYYIKGQSLRLTLEQQNIAFSKKPARGFQTTMLQFQARF